MMMMMMMMMMMRTACGPGVFQRVREHTHERRRRRRVQDVPLPGRRAAPVRHAEGRLPALRQPRVADQWPRGLWNGQRPARRHGLDRLQARIRHLSRHFARVTLHVRSTLSRSYSRTAAQFNSRHSCKNIDFGIKNITCFYTLIKHFKT